MGMVLEGRLISEILTSAVTDEEIQEEERRENLHCQIEVDEEGECHAVRYNERDPEGYVSEIILDIRQEDRLRLERKGRISSAFYFLPGQETEITYHTLYGDIDLHVETERVEIKKNRQRISVHVRYRLAESRQERHELRYEIEIL